MYYYPTNGRLNERLKGGEEPFSLSTDFEIWSRGLGVRLGDQKITLGRIKFSDLGDSTYLLVPTDAKDKVTKALKAKNCQPIWNDSNLYPEYTELHYRCDQERAKVGITFNSVILEEYEEPMASDNENKDPVGNPLEFKTFVSADTHTWAVPKYQIRKLSEVSPNHVHHRTYLTYLPNSYPKQEKTKMLLPFAFAASVARKAAWSVFDWAFVSPVKKTLSPVNTLLQFAVCYGTIAAVVYLGYRGYSDPQAVLSWISDMSPIEIRIKD